MGAALSGTGDGGLVCRRCGISYPTLRKWVRRYREAGEAGLASRSRRPTRSPNRRISEQERTLILTLRAERKLGARRIQNELRRHHDLRLFLDSIHKVLVTSRVPPLVRPVETGACNQRKHLFWFIEQPHAGEGQPRSATNASLQCCSICCSGSVPLWILLMRITQAASRLRSSSCTRSRWRS